MIVEYATFLSFLFDAGRCVLPVGILHAFVIVSLIRRVDELLDKLLCQYRVRNQTIEESEIVRVRVAPRKLECPQSLEQVAVEDYRQLVGEGRALLGAHELFQQYLDL